MLNKTNNSIMYYVTMTDKAFSGWGRARNTINKFVVECKSWEEAEIIKRNAHKRPEMKYINICINKPYYPNYKVSWKTYNELGDVWKK